MKISKKILKNGYYWEFKPFYDSLPKNLPVPEKVFEKVNTKIMTEAEMIDGNESFTKEEAFGLACKFIEEEKDGVNIIWFKDDNGVLCEVLVYRRGGGCFVIVRRFSSGDEWGAGRRSFFRNGNFEPQPLKKDALTLETFVSELEDLIKKYK